MLTGIEAGNGPPLVLLHAFPLTSAMWAPQVAALADRVRILTPDGFGFGGTPLPAGGWTIDSAADAVADLLAARGITGPVVLGGLSMGGYVALAFARRHPARLRGLILADTRAEPDGPEAKVARDAMITLAREQGSAAVFDKQLPKMLTEKTRADRPDVVEQVRRIAAAQPAESVAAALAALRDRPDATPGLAAVRVPTLVIVGADDPVTPPAAAKTLATGIPGANLEVVPEAAHLSNLEAPDAFNAAVRAFLNGL